MKNYSYLGQFKSKGRLNKEANSKYRSPFQRDRDRIIHSASFRRLKHKTQVFVNTEGDHFRTRITHSIEVAQIARSIAKYLKLNEDLAETLSLAHDLGHTPFGHAGEDALDECMQNYGGFDHNLQTLRIVMFLENKYFKFDGLNLTLETLEGLLKHNGPVKNLSMINKLIGSKVFKNKINFNTYPSLEAQISAISDDIAYNSHDLHDGLRAGLFSIEELASLPLLSECFQSVDKKYPQIDNYLRQHEALRCFLGMLVDDVLKEAQKTFAKLVPTSPDDFRKAGYQVISFSHELERNLDIIRSFLFERMYRAPSVLQMREKVTKIVKELFAAYTNDPNLMPRKWQKDLISVYSDADIVSLVCDYIAGMTDRFAISQYEKILGKSIKIS